MRRFFVLLLVGLFTALSLQAQAQPAELAVASFYPSSETTVPTDSRIVVVFNRPVVPLTLSRDQATLPSPLQIDPPLDGTGEWVNTSIYQFTPSVALAGGIDYSVSIPAGSLTAVDGSTLSQPFEATFQTQRPSIVSASPSADEVNVSQRASIQIEFSQPVDRTSAQSLTLTREDGQVITGQFNWFNDDRRLTFTPDQPLGISTRYTVRFGTAVQGAGGGQVDTSGVPFSFTTVPLPAVLRTSPFDGQTNVALADFGNTIEILFVSNMNEASLRQHVTIEPTPPNPGFSFFSPFRNTYSINGIDLAPRTRYTVTVGAETEDAEGNKLGTPFTFSFETDDAPPMLAMRSPGQIGLYNAARGDYGFYVAYRNIESFKASVYRLDTMTFVNFAARNTFFGGIASPAGLLPEAPPLGERTFVSEAPPNQYRFQLIDLAALTQQGTCAGAPVTRVQVGDTAQVILRDGPVRARREPGGEIIDLLYRGYTLRVIGGPVCEGGFQFWNVLLRDNVSAWVAEGSADEYFIAPTALVNDTTPPRVITADTTVTPGLYYVMVETPELEGVGWRDLSLQGHLMIVGTASLTIKTALDEVVVWAVDLNTGEPLANVPITLYITTGNNFTPIVEASLTAQTDAQGVATFSTPRDQMMRKRYVAVLDTDEHFSVVSDRLTDGIDPYFFGLRADFFQDYYQMQLFTDRPLYRPGQTVNFKGIVRVRTDMSYTLPEDRSATVIIRDSNYNEVSNQVYTLNAFGTLDGEFTIPADADLGDYFMELVMASPGRDYPERFYASFSVAEFRTPEFSVTGQAPQPEVVQGDEADVVFNAEYFFGGPVSGASVAYNITRQPYVFTYSGPEYYSFVNFDYYSGRPFEGFGDLIASSAGSADTNGSISIPLPTTLPDDGRSARLTVEANFSDESGQTISARVPVVVHVAEAYVGVRPERYVYGAGEDVTLNLITVDWQSNPLPQQTIDIRISRVEWRSVQELGPDGRTVFKSFPEYVTVEEERGLTTGPDGRMTYSFRPPQASFYMVTVSTRDAEGREHTANEYFWVGGGSFSLRETNSKRIELVADKPEYLIGETAQILITSPFQGEVEALVTVERGRTLRYERVRFSGSLLYDLPIEADYSPNVFVSVMLVSPAANNEDRIADFRVGYVGLNVERTRREITLTVERTIDERPAETALPAQTVRYTITATDYLGNPVQAEISAQMIDEAILSLIPDTTEPLLDRFFGPQAISVRTGTLLVFNGDAARQEILDTFKGGGGGGGGGPMGVAEVRDELLDAAYWNAVLRTDPNGVVSFDVRLPDNVTTWRLTLRALTQGADGNLLVGQAVDTLRSTKPLIIRPTTPRFFTMGDRVMLGAVVNNNTDEAQTVDVRINATGVQFVDLATETQTVRIPARGRADVSWEVIVTDDSAVTAIFSAESASFADATISAVSVDRDGTLRVYRYEVPEFIGTAGVLATPGPVTESLILPADVTNGTLDVQVEPSLAALALRTAEFVRTDESDCIECVISKLIINLAANNALNRAGALTAEQTASISAQVAEARARLLSSQLPDGGWAWTGQQLGDPLVTTYALLALTLINEYDSSISPATVRAAVSFLNRGALPIDNRLDVWELNFEAFKLWVLGRSGNPNPSRVSSLYEQAPRLHLYAKALLAQTLLAANPADPRAAQLVSELASAARLSASGARWQEATRDFFNWNTDTRTSAMVMQTLIMADADAALLANAVLGLITARRADIWPTLQETAWALWALTDYADATGELNPSFDFDVTLNGEALLSGQATSETVADAVTEQVPVSELASGANTLVFDRTAGDGVLYYTVNVQADLPITTFEEYASGFFVSRRYLRPGTAEPVDSAAVGEQVEVRITVIAPNDQYFVVIEDYLPAGMEAINPRFETSAQTGTAPQLNPTDPLGSGWGWWLFDNIQFRTQKVVMTASFLPRGTYEFVYSMRATVPGVYNVIPTIAREQFFPDIYGRSAGQIFTVTR